MFSSDGARKKWRNVEKLVCMSYIQTVFTDEHVDTDYGYEDIYIQSS